MNKLARFLGGHHPVLYFTNYNIQQKTEGVELLNLVLLKKKAAVMLCSGGEVSSRSSFVGRPHVTIETSARASVARLLDK